MERWKRIGLAIIAFIALAAAAGCIGQSDARDPDDDAVDIDDERTDVDHRIVVDIEAIPCPEGYENYQEDEVCLAYDGQIPGPTWVFEKDQRVQIELRHKVADTIEGMDVDESVAEELSKARYSMHRHGLLLDACSDGVAKIKGTEICDSTVGPGDTVTYTFDTAFPGDWHYHDHGLAFNAEPANASILGVEAEDRGLWGSFMVLEEGETTDHVFDLHVLDDGVNGGMGLDETVDAGQRFDLLAVGLGMRSALDTVQLMDPDGELVDEVLVGPGVSRGITVQEARPGTYSWTAETQGFTTDFQPVRYEGSIDVQASPSGNQADGHAHDDEPSDSTLVGPSIETAAPVRPTAWAEADRTFVIDFTFSSADARSQVSAATGGPSSGLPLLEAYAGEELAFEVVNVEGPFQHVFHMHGHPWEHPDTGAMIDAEPMPPGDTHSFTVTAGLGEGHVGDWFYHCHIGLDVGPMWSVLRVYKNSMDAEGPLDDLRVRVQDEDGQAIEGATLTARWNPNTPADPTLATAGDGQEIPLKVSEPLPGIYDVRADAPEGVAGELVLESEHDTGDSLIRLTVAPDGSYGENRHVGIDSPHTFDAAHGDLADEVR